MEYPVDPQEQQEDQFSDIANLWDRAVGDVLVCFAGLSFAKQPPVASYHDLEHGSPFADQEYAGGLQACVIVRYHESPIGMYDELLWIPGAFRHPGNGKQAYRCTRAYVSKPLAVHSGRKNWNVPKACAVFEFTRSQSANFPYSRITVSPYRGGEPFLDLTFQSTFFTRPFVTLNSRYFPLNLDFDFPPLPDDPNNSSEGLVGTSEWRRVHLEVAGKAGIVKASGTLGDGKSLPCLGKRAHWIWLKQAHIRIESPALL